MHGKIATRPRHRGAGPTPILTAVIVAVVTIGPPARAAVLLPTGIVANSYHQPFGALETDRVYALDRATDSATTFFQSGSFDTFSFNPNDQSPNATDFAGLIYSRPAVPGTLPVVFDTIRMDLGRQYNDGGSFNAVPNLYILATNSDPDRAHPETPGAGYFQVLGAALTSPAPAVFDEGVENPGGVDGLATDNTPIVFDLTALPIALRTGFGFAIGGVSGDGGVHFISVSELSATGNVPEPSFAGTIVLAGALGLTHRARRARVTART
jgi:hypothetical protein